MSISEIVAVLSDLLNRSERPTALRYFSRIQYPMRELQPQEHENGTISCRLTLIGWEYKHKGPRPKEIPVLDTEEIRQALNSHLPRWLYVSAVENHSNFIHIFIQEVKQ